jgi:hypothetical protein
LRKISRLKVSPEFYPSPRREGILPLHLTRM